jgi:hypothetical protein
VLVTYCKLADDGAVVGCGLRASTKFPRFQEEFTVTLSPARDPDDEGIPPAKEMAELFNVTKYFDVNGVFWEAGFHADVCELVASFESSAPALTLKKKKSQ